MESYFGLVAAVVIVIILALGLAIISNRAEEVKEVVPKRRNQKNGRDPKKDKTKTRRGNPKPVKDVVFGSKDGGQEDNEDQSMIELIQGTAKQVAKDAKEELKKKIQSDKVFAERQKQQNTKPQPKKKGDDKEDDTDYVTIKSRKANKPTQDSSDDAPAQVDQGNGKKPKKAQKTAPTKVDGETTVKAVDSTPSAGGSDAQRRKNKAFLKTELPPERKPGEKRPPRERRVRPEGEENTENGADGENPRPPRQPRNRPRENEEVDPNAPVVEGEERRRQPREPREPREPRLPRVVQPLPAPLPTTGDAPSLDDMLGAISNFYGTSTKKNFFSGMPRESLIKSAQFLPAKDVIALSRVNNFLNKVTRDDEIWKDLCQNDFGLKFGKTSRGKKFKPIYRDEFEKAHGKKPSTSEKKNERKPKENVAPLVEEAVVAVAPEEAKPKTERKPREKKPKDV